MEEKFDIYDFDIICDIEAEYDSEYDAEGFVEYIKETYEQELEDDDDMPLVYIGICVALSKRNIEIPEELKQLMPKMLKSNSLVGRFSENELYFKSFKKWRTNDYYAVNASDFTDNPKYIIIRVISVDEYEGCDMPYIYLAFLPNFILPTKEQMEKMIYLPTTRRYANEGIYNYKCKIINAFNKDALKKELIFLGNYDDLPNPPENPYQHQYYERMDLNCIKYYANLGLKILSERRYR